ncbi:hypothetical protein RND81_05G220300 [Saponaria officinalis]
MELIRQNNAAVAVNLNQPPFLKWPSSSSTSGSTAPPPQPPLNPPPLAANNQLYMAEDEMASWLQYPLEEFYSELYYPNPNTAVPPPTTAAATTRPPENRLMPLENRPLLPQPPARWPENRLPPPENRLLPPQPPARWTENHPLPPQPPTRWPVPPTATAKEFPLFSRMVGMSEAPEPLVRLKSLSTVVDLNDTPMTGCGTLTQAASCHMGSVVVTSSTHPTAIPSVSESVDAGEGGTDGTKTSTSSSSPTNSATVGATATTTPETGVRTATSEVIDRKRKSRKIEKSFATTTTNATAMNTHYEEVELVSGDEKKHVRGSSSRKRTRAAEIHNLSERRRRDRINEKMKELQELIPHCNKTDKASMLDEAIAYLKSLQMQVQMLSMACGMVPTMYPGMQQQYMPPMGMGMGMGMDIGMTRPVVPYTPAVPPPALPAPPAGSIMPPPAPRMPVTPYAIPPPAGSIMPPPAPRMPVTPYAIPPPAGSFMPPLAPRMPVTPYAIPPPAGSIMPPLAPRMPVTPYAIPPPAGSIMPPLAPRMPVTPYAIPLVPSPQLSVNQPSITADSSGSSYGIPSTGMMQIHNMDPYQQFLAYQQMQMQAAQSQTFSRPGSSKPDVSKSEGDNKDDTQ